MGPPGLEPGTYGLKPTPSWLHGRQYPIFLGFGRTLAAVSRPVRHHFMSHFMSRSLCVTVDDLVGPRLRQLTVPQRLDVLAPEASVAPPRRCNVGKPLSDEMVGREAVEE